jgi:hypothetical protein
MHLYCWTTKLILNNLKKINCITNDDQQGIFKQEAIFICERFINRIIVLKVATYVLSNEEEEKNAGI